MKTETGLRAQEVKPEDPFAVLSRELHRPNCKSMGKHSCEAVISIDAATIKTFVHKSYLPRIAAEIIAGHFIGLSPNAVDARVLALMTNEGKI